MKIVGMLMAYNESRNGNLVRCLDSMKSYCDEIVVYDDGSDDDSLDVYNRYKCHVIAGERNEFKKELEHKQRQIHMCKAIGADWVFRIDADEVLDARCSSGGLRKILSEGSFDSYAFPVVNLWRSPCFYRLDNSYNDVVFNRLWRCTPGLMFDVKEGLHLTNYPIGATDNEKILDFKILHYGFASDKSILDKYKMYKEHGQTGPALNRLVDESTLRLSRTKQEWLLDKLPQDNFEDVFERPLVSML